MLYTYSTKRDGMQKTKVIYCQAYLPRVLLSPILKVAHKHKLKELELVSLSLLIALVLHFIN